MKICLISSSGGHFEQLIMLDELKHHHDIIYITEKTLYNKNDMKFYFIKQINRSEKTMILKMFYNFLMCILIFFKEKPDVIISTGALSVIPMFLIGKMLRRKLIFIESFAKSNSPTLTGKFIYKFADIFIVQWESMKEVYPKAIYLGSIY